MATEAEKTIEKTTKTTADSETMKPSNDPSPTTTDTQQTAAEPIKQSLTPDLRRTLTFVAGAAVCLAITTGIHYANRPVPIKEFGQVGQEFYPDFTDPTRATSLEVYIFDANRVQPLDFRVQRLDNSRWVIPSHHNYPADAEDKLAKTASSIIGITRGAMVTRWAADHAQYGVVNPKQDTLSVEDIEGIGERIILRRENDSVLADYIIGNKLEGNSDQYYVRHPEEEEVYIVKLDIDLSTKFTDWIETDLLDVDSWDVTEVVINDYSFNELTGRITSNEVTKLLRKSSSDDWKMDVLNEEVEKIDKDAVRDTISAFADLKIAGVRPKQQGLTPELKLDRLALKSQQDVTRLQSDLLTRGFLLQPGENDDPENMRLVAREGELHTATNDGLRYHLYFGRAFTGSQEELEIGFSPDSEKQKNSMSDKEEPATKSGSENTEENDKKNNSNKPGRYVFVRVEFHTSLLGEEPVEPEKPAELKEVASKSDITDVKNESSDEEEDGSLDEIQKKYNNDLEEHERKSKDFKKNVEDGQKKSEELNRRFADWYYVISAEKFDDLRLSRKDLVKKKDDANDQKTEDEKINTSKDESNSAPGNNR